MNTFARAALLAAVGLSVPIGSLASSPARALVASVEDPALRALLTEVLEREPGLLAARARARAAAQAPAQASALPDPLLEVMAFRSPEGRQAQVEYSQELPGRGKRRLSGEAAGHDAAAEEAEVEALELAAVTGARELLIELAWLDATAAVIREERETLDRFESLARSRYEAGEGLQQDVVRLHAELTTSGLELVEIESDRLIALVALNALRGRAGAVDVPAARLPDASEPLPPLALLMAAAGRNPAIASAERGVDAALTRIELARKRGRPDFMARGGWMLMEGMDGRSGLESDEFMAGIGIRLPVRGRAIAAGIEQSIEEHQATIFMRDAALLDAQGDVAQMHGRHGLLRQRLSLNEGVLDIQADEALRSAESAYATGLARSLDLLEAERGLFTVRQRTIRLRADLARVVARLEGRIGMSLEDLAAREAASVAAASGSEAVSPAASAALEARPGDAGPARALRQPDPAAVILEPPPAPPAPPRIRYRRETIR